MLAAWNPTDNRWPMAGRALTASLVDLDVLELNPWLKLLEPIRAHLFKPLEEFFLAASAANASKTMISRGEAAARIIAAVRSAFARSRSPIATRAPSCAASRQTCWPIPLPPPVTSTA
jgi:hypothetical protein